MDGRTDGRLNEGNVGKLGWKAHNIGYSHFLLTSSRSTYLNFFFHILLLVSFTYSPAILRWMLVWICCDTLDWIPLQAWILGGAFRIGMLDGMERARKEGMGLEWGPKVRIATS